MDICRLLLSKASFDRLSSLGVLSWIVYWLFSYFDKMRQRMYLNGQGSSYLCNNSGALRGAVLPPFLLSLHTDTIPNWFEKNCHDKILYCGNVLEIFR